MNRRLLLYATICNTIVACLWGTIAINRGALLPCLLMVVWSLIAVINGTVWYLTRKGNHP